MFVLEQTPLFWWPVTVEEPSPEKPGEFIPHSFEIQLELIGRDAARELLENARKDVTKTEEDGNDELIRRMVKNWREVTDRQGQPIAFSDATFAAAWQRSWFRIGVNRAYSEALFGVPAKKIDPARTGN